MTTTRIAPSPTGLLHFGLARTALFCYLYARQAGGTYILRIEDTDLARNKPEFEADIHEQFAWLGLVPDKVFKQSEHQTRHREALESLIAQDRAYISKEPAKDDPAREVSVVRLRNPGESITFTDLIRGEITFDTTELGDFVLARSVDEPLYHMAVVVDDFDEGVTHVIRGEDHISNTQRHILIQRALGFSSPAYAHLPLILMSDKSKMSKRREGSSVLYYREQGILPAALLNYVALLGWNPGTDQEIFSLEELVSAFDIAKIQKSGAIFDPEKLRWYNREYLNALSSAEFAAYARAALTEALQARGIALDEAMYAKILPIIRERVSTLQELREMTEAGEWDFFFQAPTLASNMIAQKGGDKAIAAKHLARIHEIWSGIDVERYDEVERLKESVWEYATAEGRGTVLWPLRYALSGRERSPDPFMIASIIGKEAALARIEAARAALSI
jgi:nondiscriminating glutamyl-tRNA synthetase